MCSFDEERGALPDALARLVWKRAYFWDAVADDLQGYLELEGLVGVVGVARLEVRQQERASHRVLQYVCRRGMGYAGEWGRHTCS